MCFMAIFSPAYHSVNTADLWAACHVLGSLCNSPVCVPAHVCAQCASHQGPRWHCSTGCGPKQSAHAIYTWRAATFTPAPSSGAPSTSTCVSFPDCKKSTNTIQKHTFNSGSARAKRGQSDVIWLLVWAEIYTHTSLLCISVCSL